jgi:hypothetical protein
MTPSVEHLRLALDELEHRAQAVRDVAERRRLLLDVVALERMLGTADGRDADRSRQVENIRRRLHRLRTAG